MKTMESLPINALEKDYFILACFSENLNDFYKAWINQNKNRKQYFYDDTLQHLYWSPSNKYCSTGELLTKDNIDISVGYWTPFVWKPIREDLKIVYQKEEVFECQKIDCSCNDCIFLDRKNKHCIKLDKNVSITPNTCNSENMNCFTHRKEQK